MTCVKCGRALIAANWCSWCGTPQPDERRVTIQIVGLRNGGKTAYDGQYVVEFDASHDGVEPGTGRVMMGYLETTPDRAEATLFTAKEALELWRSVDTRSPVRPDGQPNRPLTAFTVAMEQLEDSNGPDEEDR
jgi:hypothetical protein